jgi:A/G-specific adenine glycosylase
MNDFLQIIYKWYNKNQRNLPWRETTDPYKIWISEIILQQTRVNQGTAYYQRFIEKFPTVYSLANANEEEVLKLWQGLGYYSRARNLHSAAKFILKNYNGEFPGNYEKILALNGVGPYTAAAIASIAFNFPYPALDGNIYRFLARYFGIYEFPGSGKGKKKFKKTAEKLMPVNNPGFHNEAFMEFGALQCTPKSPECTVCPVVNSCYAFRHKKVDRLPVKAPKMKQRTRYFYYYLIDSGRFTWLEKRTGKDIWKNLYQFPLIETEKELNEKEILNNKPHFINGLKYVVKNISAPQKHILSHQIIFARLIHIHVEQNGKLSNNFVQTSPENISGFAIPRLMEKLLEKSDFL